MDTTDFSLESKEAVCKRHIPPVLENKNDHFIPVHTDDKTISGEKNQILSNIKGKELLVFSQRKTVMVSFCCCDKIISTK